MKKSGIFKFLAIFIVIVMILSGCSFFDETDESTDETDIAGKKLRTVQFTPGQTDGYTDEEQADGTEGNYAPATNRTGGRNTATGNDGDIVENTDGDEEDIYDFGPSHTFYKTTRPFYTEGYAPNPTEPPVDPNEQGNSPENIAYGGFAAEKDGWIYYKNFFDNGYLYKIRTDGTEKTRVTDRKVSSINVINNWVYYLDEDRSNYIHKVRPDGTYRLLLGQHFSKSFNMIGNLILIRTSENKMVRMLTNGTGSTYLINNLSDSTSFYTVMGDTLYFINNSILYKMKTDGTELMTVGDRTDGITSYGFIGEWIYFTSTGTGNKLYRIRLDGTDLQLAIDAQMKYLHVDPDRIYFEDEEGKICCINPDGTGLIQLTGPVKTDTGYSIAGGWIYYFNGIGSFCRVRTDGTDKELVT